MDTYVQVILAISIKYKYKHKNLFAQLTIVEMGLVLQMKPVHFQKKRSQISFNPI